MAFRGIFVHVPKAGGTSMAKSFEPHKESAVITEGTNFFKQKKARSNLSSLFNFEVSSAELTKAIVGQEVWDTTFKFAFVRNPWDRYVSNWKWLTRREASFPRRGWQQRGWSGEDGNVSFEHFVKQVAKIYSWNTPHYQHDKWHLWNQVDHLQNKGGEIELDFIGRFETMEEDFSFVCEKMDLNLDLPHLNHVGFYEGHPLTKQPHYSSYYNTELVDIVAERCMPDIEKFKYDFEQE